MRIAALALAGLILLAACERKEPAPSDSAAPVAAVEVSASDELPALTEPATGIAFWIHPNVAFNSLMIVASADGVVSYNIEDGNEVSRIPGVKAEGAAVSYLGLGPEARGLFAFFDAGAGAFKLYAIDNVSRAFQPVDGEIPVRGAVRGFCFGRAMDAHCPVLHVIQKGEMTSYAFSTEDSVVKAKAAVGVSIPSDAQSCAVDSADGAVLIARKNGRIHRYSEDSQGAVIATAAVKTPGDMTVLVSDAETEQSPTLRGQIVLLDRDNGRLHVFDRESGASLGVVSIKATDEIEAVTAAAAMGAAGTNLGGLYRDGAIALGVGAADENGAPAIRIIPINGLMNALELPTGAPVNPRGQAPTQDDNGLLIETGFKPE